MDTWQETTILALVAELGLNVNALETRLDKALSRDQAKDSAEGKPTMNPNVIDEIIQGLVENIKKLSFQNDRLQRDVLSKLAK